MGRPEPGASAGTGPVDVMSLDEVLAHHGIKGMKWGVRRSKSELGANASSDAKVTKATGDKIKEHGVASVSNDELKKYLERLDLQQRYDKHAPPKVSGEAKKFIKDILVNAGKQEATKIVAKQLGKLIVKAAL